MLSKPLAFEQDKNAIFLRNQEMHLHFSKLDSIRHRKNTYLPDITTRNRNLSKGFSSLFKENDYYIRRDNNLIYKKLDKIFQRPNQIHNGSEIIDTYLNIKKLSRDKLRQLKQFLIVKENLQLKNRISKTRPVIDNKALVDEFKKSQRISHYLRKIRPNESVNSIYLNENESKLIREYEKEKMGNYLKEKGKKEKSETLGFTNRKSNSMSVENTRTTPLVKSNKKSSKKKSSMVIDKKILGKIRYV
jgi:hypothetical protein